MKPIVNVATARSFLPVVPANWIYHALSNVNLVFFGGAQTALHAKNFSGKMATPIKKKPKKYLELLRLGLVLGDTQLIIKSSVSSAVLCVLIGRGIKVCRKGRGVIAPMGRPSSRPNDMILFPTQIGAPK